MEFHSRKFSQKGAERGNSMKRVKEMFESLERSRSADICLGGGEKKDSSKDRTWQASLGFHKQKTGLKRDPCERQETGQG